MTPALKKALAYVEIRGKFPKGVQLKTRMAAYDYTTFEIVGNRFHHLTDEAKALVADEPFMRGHRFLTGRGYKPMPYPVRETSHYIEYRDGDGNEAIVYRSGSVSIHPDGRWANRLEFTSEEVAKQDNFSK